MAKIYECDILIDMGRGKTFARVAELVDAEGLKLSSSYKGGVPVQVRPRAIIIILFIFSLPFSGGSEGVYYRIGANGTVFFTNEPRGEGWILWKDGKRKDIHKEEILNMICAVSGKIKIDPFLLRAVVEVESSYDPYAISPAGAMGLMQILPETANIIGLKDPFDARENLYKGALYLKELLRNYGKISVALSAYHAGEKNVRKYNGMPPIDETMQYVKKVLKKYEEFRIIYNSGKRERRNKRNCFY